ncbi:porin [Microbulbifer sp. CAU 1566]|uniref:porin n=1 Tax=Microbulbifer sp. CAU 1566 TaxID=2933269 RepID=UPI00200406E7|nr:porin [Microbulbifer sp. CAU 1566]MCK7596692.1 porin [Microbulbifer sp. CAU 1566]
MKKTALTLALAAALPSLASAEVFTYYGKANASFQSNDEGDGAITDVKSNASRLGVKGELDFDAGIQGIYKMEYEVDIAGESDETFKQRDIYAGLQGGFGQIIGGKFDTPMKLSQKRVDLFNDYEGDIKSLITKSDNRVSNSLQYTTPTYAGFRLAADYISNSKADIFDDEGNVIDTRDNGTSIALSYENNGVYLAYAIDNGVEANDWQVSRYTAQYNLGNWQVGGLYEEQEDDENIKKDGWVTSVAYKINQWTAKAQYGQSDIIKTDGETFSLGLDYKLSKAAKVFSFYTNETAAGDFERSYVGIGTEFKF